MPQEPFGPVPKLPISTLGSFELRKGHFLQLWCADAAMRQRALLEREVGVVRTPEVPGAVRQDSQRPGPSRTSQHP
jgi:hypothetical protein